ncbi:MAG: hypothetical protein IPI02_06530 [Sterolibacteriaceae bacterium]|nr:hypothetical protein [Sterolibacteriaceae bacterium]
MRGASVDAEAAKELLTTRYAENLAGVLSCCYDRIVITGTLLRRVFRRGHDQLRTPVDPYLRLPAVRAAFCGSAFAMPLRRWQRSTAPGSVDIAKAHVRKEDVVATGFAALGDAPGLVHVISAMETCATYQPWHDKASGRTFLRPTITRACTTTYWMDRELQLIYASVPTYRPFRLQIYRNGYSPGATNAARGHRLRRSRQRFVRA